MTPKRFLTYDRILSETERTGLEEYLRRKWIAAFDFKSPESSPETGKTVRPR